MNLFDKYDEYLEELLLAQFKVSEIIDHQLEKGEIREDFLKDILRRQFPRIDFAKGIITDGPNQSGQCDIIITNDNTRIRSLGSHNLVDICDCKIVLEVKSNGKGEDFRKFNQDAEIIKNLNTSVKPLCGMFCYQIALREINLLKRFGFSFINELDIYEFSEELELKYPNIDFILSLHITKDDEQSYMDRRQFFIRWDPNNNKYILFKNYPISKHFFDLVKSIN